MASQQMSITTKEGKKPLIPVAMGKASIPPPMQVPPTRNMADIMLPLFTSV
jgi:hypothetical protein